MAFQNMPDNKQCKVEGPMLRDLAERHEKPAAE